MNGPLRTRCTRAFIGVWVVVAGSASTAQGACPLLAGDVNGDAKADVNDVMCVLLADTVAYDYLMAAPLPCLGPDPSLVDVDCDQDVTKQDVALVTEMVLGAGLDPAWDLNGNACIDTCELGCKCAFNEQCSPDGLCMTAVQGCGPKQGLQAGAPWPTLGYCNGRRWVSPFVGPEAPALWWSFDAGEGSVLEHVAVAADETAYVGDATGAVHAVDRNGHLLWRTAIVGGDGFDAPPLLGGITAPLLGTDGRILAGYWDAFGGLCQLCAIAPGGQLKWCIEGAGCVSQLATNGQGHLISGAYWPAEQVKLTQTGTPLLTMPTSHPLWQMEPVVTADGSVVSYATGPDESWEGVWANHPSGAISWSSPRRAEGGTHLTSGPDGVLYGFASTSPLDGDGAPALWALSPGGKELANIALPATGVHAPVVASDGHVLVAGADGHVRNMTADGATAWDVEVAPPAEASDCRHRVGQPTVDAQGTAFVAAATRCGTKESGVLAAIRADGQLRWSLPMPVATDRASVVLTARGILLVVDADRRHLHAIGPAK